ncbi:MAG: CoA transferase subunit A [Candidatus Lokiarchaeia archaeon]
MPLKEAISKFVKDGDVIGLHGQGYIDAVSALSEIARQKKRNLTVAANVIAFAEMLIGLGCAKKIEFSYVGQGIIGPAYVVRRAVEEGIPNPIEMEEYTHYSMALRFMAGGMGVSYMLTKSVLGSDLLKVNKKLKIFTDDETGEQYVMVPAVHPDVGIISAQRADTRGNVQFFGINPSCTVGDLARACKRVIAVVEEIVSFEEIRRLPNYTMVPFYCVDAICEAPYLAHPGLMYYYYIYDLPTHMSWIRDYWSKGHEDFLKWADEWIYGIENHSEYCEKVGWDRLHKLTQLSRKFLGTIESVKI